MLAFALSVFALSTYATSARTLEKQADIAMELLLSSTPAAKTLSEISKGTLVFPDVIKAGFVVGGQYGEGVLKKGGKTQGFYTTAAASYGLQAGAQSFGYVMFFMNDEALKYLESSSGWEIGLGPSIVVVDSGTAGSYTTSSAKDDIYVFFFNQKGLMAGLGIQGSKITKFKPDE